MNTTVLPTPPTSGAIVTGGYDNGYDNAVAELITNNNVADNGRAILAAIANGDAAIIAADQAGHLVNQKATYDAQVAGLNATNMNGTSNLKATGDASVANLKATYDAQVAGINQTNLGTVSVTKAVTDSGAANLSTTERNSGEIRMNVAKEAGENRLANAISSGEIRELINKTSFDNMIATKDNGFAIREEGCKTRELVLIEGHKTREKEAEHFAALQLQAEKHRNDIEKEMLKGFSSTQLEALKNKEELARQMAKCCCEGELREKDTQALIIKQTSDALKDELNEARFEILALKNRHHEGR